MKNNRKNPAATEAPAGARIYYIRRRGVGERLAPHHGPLPLRTEAAP